MSDFVIEIVAQAPIQVVPQTTIAEIAQIGTQGPPGVGLAEHLAEPNPHPQYVDAAELEEAIASITPTSIGADLSGAAASTMAAHLSASDPHPQYMTSAEVEALLGDSSFAPLVHQHAIADITGLETALSGKEAVGTANQAIADHVAESDPHSQYVDGSELNAAIASHVALADPHSQYSTTAEVQALITDHEAESDPHPQYTSAAELSAAIASINTDQVAEGVANLYYTNTRFNTQLGSKSTTDLAEGNKLFFTTARARASVSATGPLSFDSATGIFSLPAANGTQNGYLSSTDWTAFNNKQAALGYTPLNPANNLSEVTASTARSNLGLGTAATLSNTTATWNANQLQGRAIATTAPTDLQALRWNDTAQQWEPKTSTVLTANITDASAPGRSVLTGDPAAGRTALGTVAGPGTSTANAIARYSDTAGNLANSDATIDSSGNLAIQGEVAVGKTLSVNNSGAADYLATYYSFGAVRSDLATNGVQNWNLLNSSAVDLGRITLGTPGAAPGFAIFNAGLTNRFDFAVAIATNPITHLSYSDDMVSSKHSLTIQKGTVAGDSKVGIRTRTPSAVGLHVNGGLLISNGLTGSDPGLGNAAIAGTLSASTLSSSTLSVTGASSTGTLSATSATASTSATTGAVTIPNGGLGVSGGDCNFGNNLSVTKQISALNGNSQNGTENRVQLALGFGGTATFRHYIVSRHNSGSSSSNAIDFYTSDGVSAGAYPSNAIHGISIENGKLGVGTKGPGARLQVAAGGLAITSTTAAATDPGVGNLSVAGSATIGTTLKLGSYTTATLPTAGTAGREAYATDARWSGGVGCEVQDNGSIWITPDGVQASTTGYQRTITANRTLDRTDRIVWASTAGITITLPAVSTNKYVPYRIRNLSAGAITIAVSGADTVEGAASVSLATGGSYNLENDGTSAWRFV